MTCFPLFLDEFVIARKSMTMTYSASNDDDDDADDGSDDSNVYNSSNWVFIKLLFPVYHKFK